MSFCSCSFRTFTSQLNQLYSITELQIKLQAKCHKLRLVSKLPNKADLLLPIEGGTIAMRFYDSSRIKQLQSLEEFKLVQSKFNYFESIQQDLDLVLKFQNGNKHSVIFFLLSKKEMDNQLSTNDSVFHVIQHVVRMGVDQDSSAEVKGCSRILFVHDYNELISQLNGIKEALLPDKVEKKVKFFEVEAKKNLVQDGHAIKFDENNEYVKERVKEALQNWARRKDLDVDAVLVVLQHLESLEHVIDCTADVLKRIPVDESIKLEILKFFGPILSQSTNSTDIDNNVHSRNAKGSNIDGNMMNGPGGKGVSQNQGEDFNIANIHQRTTRMPLKFTNRTFHHMEQMDMDMTCQPSEYDRHNSENPFDFVKTPTQYREHCNFRPPFKTPNVLHTTIDQPITHGERPYVNLLQSNTQMYNDNGPDLYLVDHPPPYGSNQPSQGLFSSRGATVGSQHRNFQPQQSYAYQNPHGSVRNVETHDEQGNHIAHYTDQIGPKRFSPYRR